MRSEYFPGPLLLRTENDAFCQDLGSMFFHSVRPATPTSIEFRGVEAGLSLAAQFDRCSCQVLSIANCNTRPLSHCQSSSSSSVSICQRHCFRRACLLLTIGKPEVRADDRNRLADRALLAKPGFSVEIGSLLLSRSASWRVDNFKALVGSVALSGVRSLLAGLMSVLLATRPMPI